MPSIFMGTLFEKRMKRKWLFEFEISYSLPDVNFKATQYLLSSLALKAGLVQETQQCFDNGVRHLEIRDQQSCFEIHRWGRKPGEGG